MQLYDAVYNALIMASSLDCRSIAIPAISSGIFGFPVSLCAQLIFSAVHDYFKHCLNTGKQGLQRIRLVNWDAPTTSYMQAEFDFITMTSLPSLECDICQDSNSF